MPKELEPYITKTSDWSLVIHRVSTTTVEVWVGTLHPNLKKPEKARIVLKNKDLSVETEKQISMLDWTRPFSSLTKRFFVVHTFHDLTPNTAYDLRFDRQLPEQAREFAGQWQDLCSGTFTTLPLALPTVGNGYFTIGFGSCYFNHRDDGKVAMAYKALHDRGPKDFKPNITFLTGDQVYLDIGLDSISFDPEEIADRIAGKYEENWRLLGDIFRSGATWMLPDDHEFWNDYPFYKTLIPTLWPLRIEKVRLAIQGAAIDGVKNVQRSSLVEIINIGDEISICLADFRSNRSDDGFIDKDNFRKIIEWATRLITPGIIVTPQNLLDSPGATEKNLSDFEPQYSQLIAALASSGNDIISLTGDVHFGRIGIAELGTSGAKLIEIVSTPLSNLTGLNGIATGVATKEPDQFPHNIEIKQPNYKSEFFVPSEGADWISGYPKARTKEHFMTIGFASDMEKNIEVIVQAWLVREMQNGIPKSAFTQPFRIKLKSADANKIDQQ